MANTVSIKVESNLKLYKRAFEKAVAQGLSAIGRKAATHAKKNTPVDTGRLRNSITWATIKRQGKTYQYSSNKRARKSKNHQQRTYTDKIGTGVDNRTVVIGTNVVYGERIEEGGNGYGGAHMLRNAVTNHKQEYQNILTTSMKAQSTTTDLSD